MAASRRRDEYSTRIIKRMILGIGIDIVEIERFRAEKASEAFLKKVFTPQEIVECRQGDNRAEKYAQKFALKEAFMKAIGAGIRQEVWFTNIEILGEDGDNPQLKPSKRAKEYYEKLDAREISLSCSVSRSLAVGVVILTA